MAVKHGKLARLYWWNDTATDMTAESTTESALEAQITATALRRLNPNAGLPTIGGSAAAIPIEDVDYINGIIKFQSSIAGMTSVTVTGEYVTQANLAAVGYITDWTLNVSLDTADETAMGDSWRSFKAGLASWNASATGFFQDNTFMAMITGEASPHESRLWLIEFYVDAPAELDRYVGWGFVTGVNVNASISDLIKMPITIQGFKNIAFFTT